MTNFTNPSECQIFAEGKKGLCGAPWVRGETRSLRCVRRGISCSGILGVRILTSIIFFLIVCLLHYQNTWTHVKIENNFRYWQLNTAKKIVMVTGYSHNLSHSWNILLAQRFNSLDYQSLSPFFFLG